MLVVVDPFLELGDCFRDISRGVFQRSANVAKVTLRPDVVVVCFIDTQKSVWSNLIGHTT